MREERVIGRGISEGACGNGCKRRSVFSGKKGRVSHVKILYSHRSYSSHGHLHSAGSLWERWTFCGPPDRRNFRISAPRNSSLGTRMLGRDGGQIAGKRGWPRRSNKQMNGVDNLELHLRFA